MNNYLKDRIFKQFVNELATFIDLYLFEETSADYDWLDFFIYEKLCKYKKLVCSEKLLCWMFQTPAEVELWDQKTMVRHFLNDLAWFFSSEYLYEAVIKELSDTKDRYWKNPIEKEGEDNE